MNLFIPTVGTRLKLTGPWNFALFNETRNKSLIKNLDIPGWTYLQSGFYSRVDPKPHLVTAPAETVLTVDRIYIRSGKRGFDSITFRIHKGDSPDSRFCKTRFWAKLEDCNNIACEIERAAGFAIQSGYKNTPSVPFGG